MSTNKDGISLKELMSKLNNYFLYIRSQWRRLLIIVIIGACLGLLYSINTKPRYKGELSFVLSGSSGPSGLMGLAGQFGLDLSNSSGDDAFQGDNIVELLKSQKIVKRALFQLLPDSSDVLINLFVRESGIMTKWQTKDYLRRSVPFPLTTSKLTPIQDSLFKELHAAILKKYLVIRKIDKKLSFYNVTTETTSEAFSALFTRSLVNEATRFYVETKTKTAKDNLNMLQHEADSIRYILGNAVGSAALATDRTFNLNAALQINRTSLEKSQIQVEVLGTAYGEVIKNLEIAKITLQKETPLVQVIDEPVMPLKVNRVSKAEGVVLGCSVFAFFGVCLMLFYKTYKNK